MRRVIVRYRLKPSRVEEHEKLIADVFSELKSLSPEGLRYEVIKLPDGVSYEHQATVIAADNPLPKLASFKAFTADIKSRCDEAPVSSDVTTLQSYAP